VVALDDGPLVAVGAVPVRVEHGDHRLVAAWAAVPLLGFVDFEALEAPCEPLVEGEFVVDVGGDGAGGTPAGYDAMTLCSRHAHPSGLRVDHFADGVARELLVDPFAQGEQLGAADLDEVVVVVDAYFGDHGRAGVVSHGCEPC
jgi:hypothetical protein